MKGSPNSRSTARSGRPPARKPPKWDAMLSRHRSRVFDSRTGSDWDPAKFNADREAERTDWDDVAWPTESDDVEPEPSDGFHEVFACARLEPGHHFNVRPVRQRGAATVPLTLYPDIQGGMSRGIARHVVGYVPRQTRDALLRDSAALGVPEVDLLRAWMQGEWEPNSSRLFEAAEGGDL